jgi:hypothetical protein
MFKDNIEKNMTKWIKGGNAKRKKEKDHILSCSYEQWIRWVGTPSNYLKSNKSSVVYLNM